MKKRLSYLWIIVCCTAIVSSCEHEEQIIPHEENQLTETTSDQHNSLRADAAGRKKSDNPFTSSVTGKIDGRDFTGNLTITEFAEEAGALYARASLEHVKITGKDHKSLEYILEQETFSIPVTIDGMQQAVATSVIAQVTCSILNLSLNGLDVNVLGLAVQIDPVTFSINANDDEVLGNLICTVLDTLNSVVDLVGLLNELLGLLSL